MLTVALDKLTPGEQIVTTCELVRRLNSRLALLGIKFVEGDVALTPEA